MGATGVPVYLSIESNYPLVAYCLTFTYDPEILDLESITPLAVEGPEG